MFYKTSIQSDTKFCILDLSLEINEMKTLRGIINKTKWDRVRNDRIRELCEIQNITSWVQRRRTEWSEHIPRMADDRLVKKYTTESLQERETDVDR